MSATTGWGWLAWVDDAVWCVDSEPWLVVVPYRNQYSTGPPTLVATSPESLALLPLTLAAPPVKPVAQPEPIKAKSSSAMRPHLAMRRAYRNPAPRLHSGPLRARSSVGERSLHTREVAGSNPAAPTPPTGQGLLRAAPVPA